eukprot:CAMPEP_0114112284 /NCGR_PEP_ID=MMETSP0043_2-20121206/2307_1 /TAXON_ID=464988 /ORGANISM="Hemiselmis andersenii, Strain CCMP644" /LENGTH=1220 /DNA_ID=CAMNT_0001204377 /DNA_START=108 /DNA_END=3771 /DNA_ORIENTATION=+
MVRERPASARPRVRNVNAGVPARPASATVGAGGGELRGGRRQRGEYVEGGEVVEDEDDRELLSGGTQDTLTETWLNATQEGGGSSYPWLQNQVQHKHEQSGPVESQASRDGGEGVANSGLVNVAASLLDAEGRDAVVQHGSSDDDDEEDLLAGDDAFFIEDDGGEEGDDAFDCDQWGGNRSTQPWRPASAVRGRPESANQRSRAEGGGSTSVWQWAAIDGADDDALPQRLEALRLPLLHLLEPLVSKCGTGNIGKLVGFVQKGRADMCVSAVEDAARTLSKTRGGGGDSTSVSQTAYRLVVVGMFCGLMLVHEAKWTQAKEVLKKVLLLTGSYTKDYRHKTSLRVWTLVALAELHMSMGMPQVAFEYVETGIDAAEAAKSLSCRMLCLVIRASLFCSSLQFSRAVSDCECANRTLAKMDRGLSVGAGWAPFGRVRMSSVVSACVHHAHAISLLCQQPPRLKEAAEAATSAWAVASKLEEGGVGALTQIRRGCLRVRDLLVGGLEGEFGEKLVAQVRAATMRPVKTNVSEPTSTTAAPSQRSASAARGASSATVRSSSAASHQGTLTATTTKSESSKRPSAGEDHVRGTALLLAVMEATLRQSQEIEQGNEGEGGGDKLDVFSNLEVIRKKMRLDSTRDGPCLTAELGEGGPPAGVLAACERHMRGSWLRHSPVVQMRVSKAVHDFSTMLWSLHERGRHSDVIARDALQGGGGGAGAEQCEGCLLALCIDCVDFGAERFNQTQYGGRSGGGGDDGPGPMEDALAYFGVALTLTQREEMSEVLRRVVRAWVFDCVAECHYHKGDFGSCKSFLESAIDACSVQGGEAETLSLTEIRYGVLTHMIECHLKMGSALEALEVSLQLLNMLKSCSPHLFKYPPKLPLGLRPAFARCSTIDQTPLQELEQKPTIQIVSGDEVSEDAGSRFGIDVALWAPKLHASAAALGPGIGTRQKRRGQQRAVHSCRYLTAHVAYACACASARVGKLSDALSLVEFAKVNGERCVESWGWDGEKGRDSLERRVSDAGEMLRYIIREGEAPDSSLFRGVVSKEVADGGGAVSGAMGSLLKHGTVYHAMYQALASGWEARGPAGGGRPQRPASASQLEVRRRILSVEPPTRGMGGVSAGPPPRPGSRTRPSSALGASKGRPASALGVSREGGELGVGAVGGRRRPASALGAVKGGGWPGGGVERDEVRVAGAAYGQRLRPASASMHRDERRRPASAAA